MQQKTFDVFCPTCNILVEAKVIASGADEYRSEAVNPMDEVDAMYHGDYYSVALCRRCNDPFLLHETLCGVPGEFEVANEHAVLYPVPAGSKFEGLPDSIGGSLTQAHRSYSTTSYDACALMCRRGLEALCRTLQAKGNGLSRQLADLKANGRIDARLLDWAHGVRLVGNEAAHDVDMTVTAEDARDILEFTEALLMYVFTLDAKFQSFEARRKSRTDGSGAGATG